MDQRCTIRSHAEGVLRLYFGLWPRSPNYSLRCSRWQNSRWQNNRWCNNRSRQGLRIGGSSMTKGTSVPGNQLLSNNDDSEWVPSTELPQHLIGRQQRNEHRFLARPLMYRINDEKDTTQTATVVFEQVQTLVEILLNQQLIPFFLFPSIFVFLLKYLPTLIYSTHISSF